MNDQLNSEEQEILEKFERGELRPAREAEREMETARQATRSTFHKTRRVNLRGTENTYRVGWSRRDRTPTKTQWRKNR